MVNATPRPPYTRDRKWYQLIKGLGGPQGRSGRLRKISPPPKFDPRTIQHVAIPTEPTTGYLFKSWCKVLLYKAKLRTHCNNQAHEISANAFHAGSIKSASPTADMFQIPNHAKDLDEIWYRKIFIKVFRHFHFNSRKWAPKANFFFLFFFSLRCYKHISMLGILKIEISTYFHACTHLPVLLYYRR